MHCGVFARGLLDELDQPLSAAENLYYIGLGRFTLFHILSAGNEKTLEQWRCLINTVVTHLLEGQINRINPVLPSHCS